MTPRLNLVTLAQLPRDVAPLVDPRALAVGIVHLGIGAFHRAHQAVYTEDAIAAEGGAWGICGVSQRSPAVVEQLRPQDGLYTLAQRDGAGERLRVIGAVRELYWVQADADAVRRRIAAPTTRVVTLTVTEKGYHHDPATNRLALDDPAVAADLADGGSRTVVGQLAGGLARRRAEDGGPVTVLCCDNLPHNGHVLSGLVADFVHRVPASDGLGDWIAANVTFPSTMVDRITPATTEDDLARIAAELGARDEGAVVTEPFTQWVIEDAFAAGRPAWERAGAIMTGDVRPYEQIKLRLLNGSHSALAYLAVLADDELVSDAVRPDAPFLALLQKLMAVDVAPTLSAPDGFDLDDYEEELLERFANPALRHRTIQIAMDGSQKLPMRLLGTIRDRRRAGAEPVMASLGVAAWMRFVSARRSDGGHALTVDDPLADVIADRLGGREDAAPVVDTLLSMSQIFDEELAADAAWRDLLIDQLDALIRDGAARTARRVAG
ncbi:MAG TPA: mannitol dehydrogenase family protein [Solirubrobacteraceae bacterium]|nr:mannitol dehydrogenase family protein [Solirubrobacteraceae bacterium]